MTHTATKSESDVTSLAPSSPSRSPKRPIYYVQSPSRDSSHDGDKYSMYNNSPLDSPDHQSYSRHSRNSSASRFSGIFRSSSGRKVSRKKGSNNGNTTNSNEKGWPECKVIMEEGDYYGDHDNDEKGLSRRMQILIGILGFVVLFTVFCLIIWGAARPFKAQVSIKSLKLSNFIIQEATDFSGVPTKMVTIHGKLRIGIHNPATFFGIHVTSNPIRLLYSQITVATGQLKNHYQPRKSHRTVAVNLEGTKVPLYGAGSNITLSSSSSNTAVTKIPFMLEFDISSRGYVVGKLVRTKHRRHISCSLMIDYATASSYKLLKFKKNTCSYK